MNAQDIITMNAEHGLSELAVICLHASPTNPRKHFDAAGMQELTDSVKQHGIIQPLLVRPMASSMTEYEIVCGERRYRAAQAALLESVPCLVRYLTDAEVIALQLIENLQRIDLNPLEEAEGYKGLIAIGIKAEDIGSQTGKSRSYIYARLKLLDLSDTVKEAIQSSQIDTSTALLIARLPAPSMQEEALRTIINGIGAGSGDPMSYRAARSYIHGNFTRPFKAATFPLDDATLIPVAGPCTTCPKRTSINRDLYPETSADVCTDPTCFNAKNTAVKTPQTPPAEQTTTTTTVVVTEAAHTGGETSQDNLPLPGEIPHENGEAQSSQDLAAESEAAHPHNTNQLDSPKNTATNAKPVELPTIFTHSGIYFNFAEPVATPAMIRIEDIAHALAHICRFGGHTSEFYSVAQHCVMASNIVPPAYALQALLHDASEAYIGDIVRPLKHQLTDYKAIERRIESAIAKTYGLPDGAMPAEVTQADLVMLATEQRDLMPAHDDIWPCLIGITPLAKPITPWSSAVAKHTFINRFAELTGQTIGDAAPDVASTPTKAPLAGDKTAQTKNLSWPFPSRPSAKKTESMPTDAEKKPAARKTQPKKQAANAAKKPNEKAAPKKPGAKPRNSSRAAASGKKNITKSTGTRYAE